MNDETIALKKDIEDLKKQVEYLTGKVKYLSFWEGIRQNRRLKEQMREEQKRIIEEHNAYVDSLPHAEG